MHGRLLAFADDHHLLGVALALRLALVAVAHGEQDQAPPRKIAGTEVGDVPAHLMVAQILRGFAGPFVAKSSTVQCAQAGRDQRLAFRRSMALRMAALISDLFIFTPRERRRESRLNAVWSVSTRASTAINRSARKPPAGRRIAIRSPGDAPTGDALSVATPE